MFDGLFSPGTFGLFDDANLLKKVISANKIKNFHNASVVPFLVMEAHKTILQSKNFVIFRY